MPDEENKMVPIDTSGPDAEVDIEEQKEEAVVETENTEQDTGTDKTFENERETRLDEKKQDENLEDYSKGVQSRIAKLTRKMREAERREQAAVQYARAVEEKRQVLEKKFEKTDSEYVKKFETSINTGLEAAQKELSSAIENGDATAQVEANKRIATLAFENAKLEQTKEGREQRQEQIPVNVPQNQVMQPTQTMQEPINTDPRADAWASNNSWFGNDRAMTYTAFEIHKDLTDKEGYDPNSDEYYAEVDKRIRVDFPHKFGNTNNRQTTAPVQTVASATRSVQPGRKTVRLPSPQVATAKKLGVPLEDYAKQLKLTKEGA